MATSALPSPPAGQAPVAVAVPSATAWSEADRQPLAVIAIKFIELVQFTLEYGKTLPSAPSASN